MAGKAGKQPTPNRAIQQEIRQVLRESWPRLERRLRQIIGEELRAALQDVPRETPTRARSGPQPAKGTAGHPRRRRPTARKTRGDSAQFRQVLDWFGDAWRDAHGGEDYLVQPSDRQHVGRALNGMTGPQIAKLPQVFARYMADKEPFIARQGHSATYLFTNGRINAYRAGRRGKPASNIPLLP